MASIPIENKVDIERRVRDHAAQQWPAIETVMVRFRGGFAYLAAILAADGAVQPLCRLRYKGNENEYAFALWRASHDDYDDAWLPDGSPTGTPEAALDLAATLYIT